MKSVFYWNVIFYWLFIFIDYYGISLASQKKKFASLEAQNKMLMPSVYNVPKQ